jgi:hypothetical protein
VEEALRFLGNPETEHSFWKVATMQGDCSMIDFALQQVPPQPVPGDLPVPPPPGPGRVPEPVSDPMEEPPPIGDPDVVDPSPDPDITPPMVA